MAPQACRPAKAEQCVDGRDRVHAHLPSAQGVAHFAPLPVIVLTGHGEHGLALQAVEAGAWDFITKPIDPDMLRFVAARALRKSRLDAELRALRASADADDMGLVGQSQAMTALRAMVRRIGPTEVSVLVLGPTGTGKELVARALHRCSRRSNGPFVAVHCGALSAELLESELFGHLRGSFTGAYRDKPGLVEAADGGTLFLPAVGDRLRRAADAVEQSRPGGGHALRQGQDAHVQAAQARRRARTPRSRRAGAELPQRGRPGVCEPA
jgi:transcriptional regulator of acetoin/glycerol metabolism